MKRVLFFSAYGGHGGVLECLEGFFNGCLDGRVELVQQQWTWRGAYEIVKRIRAASLVLLWNGDEPGGDWVRRVCQAERKQLLIAENGFLPQLGYWHLDPKGITGGSSLCGDLSWVTEEQIRDGKRYASQHLEKKGWAWLGREYVLVPLQLENDTSIYLHSPFKSMSAFLRHVCSLFPGRRVMVSCHPRDRRKLLDLPANAEVCRDGRSTMDLAQYAEVVVGITSTVLYECLALGVPVMALGRCPLSAHVTEEDRRRLLGAVVSRQIPRRPVDLGRWLRALGVDGV